MSCIVNISGVMPRAWLQPYRMHANGGGISSGWLPLACRFATSALGSIGCCWDSVCSNPDRDGNWSLLSVLLQLYSYCICMCVLQIHVYSFHTSYYKMIQRYKKHIFHLRGICWSALKQKNKNVTVYCTIYSNDRQLPDLPPNLLNKAHQNPKLTCLCLVL